MGMPGPLQLLLILAIVIVLFGAKRLKNIGSDLGGAVKGFKSAVKEEEDPAALEDATDDAETASVKDTVTDAVKDKNENNV